MTSTELEAVVRGIAPVVRGHIADAVKELVARVAALEARPVVKEQAPDGRVDTLSMSVDSLRGELRAYTDAPKHPNPDDVKALIAEQLPQAVAGEVEKAVASIPKPRDGQDVDPVALEALVVKHVGLFVAAMPAAKDGESVTIEDVEPLVSAEVSKAVAGIPVPRDGKDVDATELEALVKRLVDAAVAHFEVPKDGKSVTVEEVAPLVASEVAKAVAAIPPAKDGDPGRSVDLDALEEAIVHQVHKAVAEIPKPRDGVSVTVQDVAPVIAQEVSKAVAAIPQPKDPIGMLGALIDREGHLVLTLSDGSIKNLGLVVGRDVEMAAVTKRIQEELSTWPKPKDGVDGLGFDDLSVLHDGERGFSVTFRRGEHIKEFPFTIPCVLYLGVYSEGKTYQVGDSVTFGGHLFIARAETALKPDFTPAATKVWTLSAKAGRDGRSK